MLTNMLRYVPRVARGAPTWEERVMYVVCVSVHVKEPHVAAFVAAITANATATRNEPGNVRFDVHQQEQDPARFTLVEVYRAPEDFTAHQRTEHYVRFRDEVADWMAEPRVGVRHRSVFPPDAAW
jgi:autoinducer 2-degrading protein